MKLPGQGLPTELSEAVAQIVTRGLQNRRNTLRQDTHIADVIAKLIFASPQDARASSQTPRSDQRGRPRICRLPAIFVSHQSRPDGSTRTTPSKPGQPSVEDRRSLRSLASLGTTPTVGGDERAVVRLSERPHQASCYSLVINFAQRIARANRSYLREDQHGGEHTS
jgi:hypothetical protein